MRRTFPMSLLSAWLLPISISAALLAPAPGVAATFVVDSLLDDTFADDANPGDGICDDSFPTSTNCTLRAAIQEANALPGRDIIQFAVAGTIAPDSGNLGPLPVVTDTLTIDGTSAPGWSTLQPTLYLDGTAIDSFDTPFAAGLEVSSAPLEVYGLGIVAFPTAMIRFNSSAVAGRVDGCVLGLDAAGNPVAHPNSLSNHGMMLRGEGVVIGVPLGGTGVGNVISGNRAGGILVAGDTNQIRGNLIGMTPDGLQARSNGNYGIFLYDTADGNRIGTGDPDTNATNRIANHTESEILIDGSSNLVDGNAIGFDPASGTTFNVFAAGIQVAGDGHTIGGPLGNRILDRVGGGVAGIQLGLTLGGADRPATNVIVDGNDIGTVTSAGPETGIEVRFVASTGNTIRNNRVADASTGIRIGGHGNLVEENRLGIDADLGFAGGPGNLQGIVVASDANQIRFNEIGNSQGFGVLVDGSANDLIGNDIGFAAGLGDVGNAAGGIRLIFDSLDNLIQGNRIYFNDGPGVELANSAGIAGTTVFGNSFRNNAGIGVDFLTFVQGIGSVRGPTPNDPGDADGGANRRMNHPEFSEADPIAGTNPVETVVTFRVDSDPANQAYPITVDFYRADAYGDRQGVQFLDTATFSTFGSDSTITLELPGGIGIDDHVTALATDADGNTSEFAPARSLGEVLFRDSYES